MGRSRSPRARLVRALVVLAVVGLVALLARPPLGAGPAVGPVAPLPTKRPTAEPPALRAAASGPVVYASAVQTAVLRNGTVLNGIRAVPNCPTPGQVVPIASGLVISCGFGYQSVAFVDPTSLAMTGVRSLAGTILFSGAFGYDSIGNCLYLGGLNWTSGFPRGNISVFNLTTGTITATLAAATEPQLFAFDPTDHRMFAAIPLLGYLSIVDTAQPRVLTTLSGYGSITAMAFDPANDELVVTNQSARAMVMNASNMAPVGAFSVGQGPDAIAVDGATGRAYVANGAGGTVTAADLANLSVLQTLTVGSGPGGLALDPGAHRLFVANSGSANVSVVNTSSLSVETSLGAGEYPGAIAFDPATGDAYLADPASENISAINATTLRIDATAAIGAYPGPVLFDPASQRLLVADDNRATLDEYAAGTASFLGSVPIPVSGGVLTYLALDTASDTVWVTHPNGVVEVDVATRAITANLSLPGVPYGIAYDAGTRTVAIALGSGNLSIVATGNATVVDTLALGTYAQGVAVDPGPDWAFTGVIENGSVPQIAVVNLTSDTIVGRVRAPAVWLQPVYDPVSGEIVASDGSSLIVVDPSNLSSVSTLTPPSYSLTLASDPTDGQLFGAAPSQIWALPTLRSGTGYRSADGWVGAYGLAVDTSRATLYSTDLTNGTIDIVTFGAAVTPLLASPAVVNAGSPVQLNLTILASTGTVQVRYSGLPTDCSSQSVTSLSCASNIPGQYAVTATVVDGSGLPTNVTANFTVQATGGGGSVNYTVAMHESGLPLGRSWSATVGSTTRTGTSAYLIFSEPNGSYGFQVSAAGYAANRSSGTVVVDGGDVTEEIGFQPLSSSTTGRVEGTVSPSNASVRLGTLAVPTQAGRFDVNVTAGSYDLVASAPGFRSYSENLTVLAGSTTNVTIQLVRSSPGSGATNPPPTTPGLLQDQPLLISLLAAVGVVAIGLAYFAVYRRRRSARSPPGPESEAEAPDRGRPET